MKQSPAKIGLVFLVQNHTGAFASIRGSEHCLALSRGLSAVWVWYAVSVSRNLCSSLLMLRFVSALEIPQARCY